MRGSGFQAPILLLLSLNLPECNAYGQDAPGEAQKIIVATVLPKDVTITQQYVGQIHSQRHIEVRAPVEGYLAAIPIGEGQAVKTGDVMFEFGPILYKARLDFELAEREFAQLELNFTRKMANQNAISQDQVKLIETKMAKAQAKVDLASAELDLTRVRAPFDGLIGRLLRQQGSFVLKGETLTTLSDNSVMGVYFNVPESRYLEYMAEQGQAQQGPAVELLLSGNGKFPRAGKIGAIEADFNHDSGSIPFRADFPNPDGLLRHGQTGTVLINRVLKNAIAIPQRATFEHLAKRYVYVVDKDNVAHRREIVIQNELEDLFVIKAGIEVGNKIVVGGVTLVRDGDKVE